MRIHSPYHGGYVRLDVLVTLIEAYEARHWAIESPNPPRLFLHEDILLAERVDGVGVISEGNVNHWQRAYLAWEELGDYARNRNTVSYETLGRLIGIHNRAVKFALALIQDYCLREKLPPLTILVVSKGTGTPGQGFIAWDADNLEEGLERVFSFGWAAYGNPFGFAARGARREDVVEQLVADPSSAKDVYAVTRVRGAAQMLFREALIQTYDGTCAFSGSRIREGVEATHIVPWSQASSEERLNIRNGILLTSWHHRLFDAGLLSIDEDCRLHLSPKLRLVSHFDQQALSHLQGTRIILPKNPDHHPAPEFIRKRNQLMDATSEAPVRPG